MFDIEEIPILPAVAGLLAIAYFGYEVEHRRSQLRAVFNVFDKNDSKVAASLEAMVARGELKPYAPGTPI